MPDKVTLEDIQPLDSSSETELPFAGYISAGIPAPAADYVENTIDLNRELIKNPRSTYIGRVSGMSMKDAGIENQDIVIVDKSLQPSHEKIAVCYIDGEFTLKRIWIVQKEVFLMPENKDYQPIKITPENHFLVWGIVTYVIKKPK
jgi:DNA polymerase V